MTFGQRFIWIIKELVKTASNEPSFFSQKRCKSWMLFFAVLGAWLWYMCQHIATMSAVDFTVVSTPVWGYGGYMVGTIQREKRDDDKKDPV